MGSRIRFRTAVLLLATTVYLIQAFPSFIEEAQLEDLENFEDEIEGIGVETVLPGQDDDLKDVQAETETLDEFSGGGRGGGGARGRGDRGGDEGGDRRGGEGGDRHGGKRRHRRRGRRGGRRGGGGSGEGGDRRGGEGEGSGEGGNRRRGEGEGSGEGGDRRGGEREGSGEGGDRRRGEGECSGEGGDRRGGEGEGSGEGGDRRGGEGEGSGEGGDRRGGEGGDRRGGEGEGSGEGGDRRGGEGGDRRGGEGEGSGEGGDRRGGEGEGSGEGGDRRGGEGEGSGEGGDRRGGEGEGSGEGGDRRGGEGGDRRGGEGEGSGEGGDRRGGEGEGSGEGGDRRGGEVESSGEGGDRRGGEGGDRRGGEGSGEGGDRRGGEGEGSGEGGDRRGGEGGDRRGGEGGDRRGGEGGDRRGGGDRRRPSMSCGKTPFKHHLIVDGENAHPHDWPWQVALYLFGKFHCGGSLIEKDWVLTAAHCVFPYPRPNAYTVDVGVHNLNGATPVRKAYNLSRIIIHELFDPATKRADNDIALLQLDGSIIPSHEVNIVCLPVKGSRVPVGKQCWGTGWGKTVRGGPVANILQQAMLPIADHHDCSLTNSGLSPPVEEETMVCAGGEGEGGCQVGSGGPLVCRESGSYVLRGIVSWGDPFCRTDFYSVFARVSNFIGWINRNKAMTGCGRKPAMHPLVVNGENASPHAWPWQVALYLFGRFNCGGSLIAKDWVLTAAHCVFYYPGPGSHTVVVGAHDLRTPTSVQRSYRVRRVIIFERYNPAGFVNDVALLQLDGSIVASDKVNVVCLPRQGSRVPVGKQCYITGWGRTGIGMPAANILQQAIMPIADHNICDRTTGLRVIKKVMVCAGGQGISGGCKGDSGGPLVCEESGRYVVRGIVSWGDGRCRTNYVTVFARVSSFTRWINQKMAMF